MRKKWSENKENREGKWGGEKRKMGRRRISGVKLERPQVE